MVGQKMLRVKPGQLRTVELGQESEGTVLHHIIVALALISRPHEISRHIGLSAKTGGPQFVCFFSFYFQSDAVFTQQFQFFFYAHGSSSLLRSHSFPSSASAVIMAAESNLHCRSSRPLQANT